MSDEPNVRLAEIDRRGFLKTTGAAAGTVAVGATPASAGSYTTTDLTISSHDGTSLAATLYEPDDGQAHEAVLMTHGWGSNRKSGRVTEKAKLYASNGYVVLTYDSRGFGESGGEVGLDGPKEVDDASTLVDWLAGRDNVLMDGTGDPKVGMDGYSYSGGIQLLAAAADDRIDAIVPRITWNDLEYAVAPHGVVKIGWLTLLLGLGGIKSWDFETGNGLDADLWDWYLDAAWNNELSQDAKDAFAQRSPADEISNVNAPTFLIQGWDDTLFKPVEALRTYRSLQDRGVETRICFYEGGHALEGLDRTQSEIDYLNGLALDWMDRHVKGKATDVPQSTMYLKQADAWRTHDQFPPSDASETTLKLSETADGGDTYLEKDIWWWNDTEYRFDWRAGSDFEIVGAPELDIWVYPEGPEERLFFNFYHTDADGHTKMINDMGETYRVEGADQYHRVQIQFSPIQRFLQKDETISLGVSISNPFYFDSRESEGVYIGHSADYPSKFTLPMRSVSDTHTVEKDLAVGDEVHVSVENLDVRTGPGTSYDSKKQKHVYSSGKIVDGPTAADGDRWWKVRYYEDDGGIAGWSNEVGLDRGARNSERLSIGDRVEVNTGSDRLNIREGPGTGYTAIDAADDGDRGRVVNGPEWADGYVWWKVEYDNHAEGWSAQDWLTLV
ncbi:CocE/NonD family hydrolase [Halorussus caseinilyticus]|uniref:CocE/NonD family hydrolase n=1 Tax=Halorussus caseinilyticus TaxID=3034025 RepID=UPI0023E7820C|nr:CocE/NonD family hydrolase [Halorussus sp. DT72]